MNIHDTHCLMPFRDTLVSRTSQIKEGINRLACLIPYDIVTYKVRTLLMCLVVKVSRPQFKKN